MAVYLNVAEKPSVARAIVNALTHGGPSARVLASHSKFNSVSEFQYKIKDQLVTMRVTSVTGHLMELYFTEDRY
jgi:DNA topoisomerase IA